MVKTNLITIKTYGNRVEAEADKNLIENYNIKAVIFADDCGGACPHMTFTGGVQLLTNKENQKEVRKILKIDNE